MWQDALPLEEVLPWDRFSLRVPADRLATLREALRAADQPAALRAMRAELGCAWRSLFWSSVLGSCFGEPLRGDAFDTLMAVLRRRLLPSGLRRQLALAGGGTACTGQSKVAAGLRGTGAGKARDPTRDGVHLHTGPA